jgi:cytochrome P450
MDYGPSWRHSRKLANVALNSDAVVKYHQVQEQHTAIFLDSIIREPSKFIENLRLWVTDVSVHFTVCLCFPERQDVSSCR